MKLNKHFIEFLIIVVLVIIAGMTFRGGIAASLNNKAIEALEEGNPKLAISLLQKANKAQETSQGCYNLGYAFEQAQDLDNAVLNYKKALELNPEYTQAYEAVVDLYRSQEKYGLAKEFEQFQESLPAEQQKIGLFNKGVALYAQRDYHGAISSFEKVIKLDPDFSQAHYALGVVYFKQNQWEQAIAYFKTAASQGINDAVIYNNLGISYMNLEEYAKGAEYLRQAYRLDPENNDIGYSLASTLRDNGEFAQAMDLYQEIVIKAGHYPNIHNDIAGIYELRGETAAAQKEFALEMDNSQALINEGISDAYILENLAIAYSGLGQQEQARAILDRIISSNAEARRAYYARSVVHEKMGNQELADQDMQRSKEILADRGNFNLTLNKLKAIPVLIRNNSSPGEQRQSDFNADTRIYLKNGRTMKGRLKTEDESNVVLEVLMGDSVGIISFGRSKIMRMEKL